MDTSMPTPAIGSPSQKIASDPPPFGSSATMETGATMERGASTFVLPTSDGGQTVIREPRKVAVSGHRVRELRSLPADQKAARRTAKNVIVFSILGALLFAVLWWLLGRGAL